MANNKKALSDKKGINSVTAGAIGAAIGAVVGVAALGLTSDKNRKAVQKKLGEFRKEGEKAYTQFKKTTTEVNDKLEEVSSLTEGKVEHPKRTKKMIRKSAFRRARN